MGKFLLLITLYIFISTAAAKPILRLVYEDYPPYEFQSDTSSFGVSGVHAEIIKEVIEDFDYEIRFEELPWARAIEYVKDGKADGIFSLYKTSERSEFLYYPEEYLSIEKIKLFKSSSHSLKKEIKNLGDLAGLTVGVVRGYSCGEEFDNLDWLKREYSKDSESLLRKQAFNRTDVSALNDLVIINLANKLNLNNKITILDYVVSEEPLYLAFSKNSNKDLVFLMKHFDNKLKNLRKDKNYQLKINSMLKK